MIGILLWFRMFQWRKTVQTKQPNLGPMKRGGLGPDQIEPWLRLDFDTNYRKLWQVKKEKHCNITK